MAATIVVAVSLTPAWAASVTGHAVVGAGDDVLRIVSVDATSLDQHEGTATGRVDVHDPMPTVGQDVDGTGDPRLAAHAGVDIESGELQVRQ